MILHMFFFEVLKIKKVYLSAEFNKLNPKHFISFKKIRNIKKIKISNLPIGNRNIKKSISQKFQGLHRRSSVLFDVKSFEKKCEIILIDHVSRNFYVDHEEINNDFFFNEKQVASDGVKKDSSKGNSKFSDYFENSLMDIEKLNRLGKTTTFGFRFGSDDLKISKNNQINISHNFHLRYSESMEVKDEVEYLYNSFSPKIFIICKNEYNNKNKNNLNLNLKKLFGKEILP